MKPYIITEAQFLLGCVNPNESDNLTAYAEIAATYGGYDINKALSTPKVEKK